MLLEVKKAQSVMLLVVAVQVLGMVLVCAVTRGLEHRKLVRSRT